MCTFYGSIPLTSQQLLLSAIRDSERLSGLRRLLGGLRFLIRALLAFINHCGVQSKTGKERVPLRGVAYSLATLRNLLFDLGVGAGARLPPGQGLFYQFYPSACQYQHGKSRCPMTGRKEGLTGHPRAFSDSCPVSHGPLRTKPVLVWDMSQPQPMMSPVFREMDEPRSTHPRTTPLPF